ncbi:hypothetical protein [Streptomyces agglomeratus]|nr:hypothetical protein [Streptomyces agglomeratus]
MTPPLPIRMHLMITCLMVTFGTLAGATLGLVASGQRLALVLAGAGGLGAGIWALLSRRQIVGFFQALLRPAREVAPVDGRAEGLADIVLASLSMYQAAMCPLTPSGVTDQERKARREVAYRLSPTRVCNTRSRCRQPPAGAIDQAQDARRAAAAMSELHVTVYNSRGGR